MRINPVFNIKQYKNSSNLIKCNSKIKSQTKKFDYIGLNSLFFYNISFQGRPPVAVYAIDRKGNYTRFDSIKGAAKDLGLLAPSISITLARGTTTGGYTFLYAKDVEKKHDDGSVEVDSYKINDALNNFQTSTAIYCISENGEVFKFNSQKEASVTLGIDYSSIVKCVQGLNHKAGGYFIVRTNQIDEDGMSVEQRDIKLQDFVKSHMKKRVLAFDTNTGEVKIYKDAKQAIKELNLDPSCFYKNLKNLNNTVKGYKFEYVE